MGVFLGGVICWVFLIRWIDIFDKWKVVLLCDGLGNLEGWNGGELFVCGWIKFGGGGLDRLVCCWFCWFWVCYVWVEFCRIILGLVVSKFLLDIWDYFFWRDGDVEGVFGEVLNVG